MWDYRIPIPLDISKTFLEKYTDRRVVCTINETLKHHCALMPGGDGTYYIMLNKEIRKKLRLKVGESIQVRIEKDTSEYGMPMPEEFQEVLWSDEEGSQLFHDLTPGKQRSLIHIVGKVKSSDIRINKALVILEHLKRQGGKLDFKQLMEDFKNYTN